LNYFLVLREGRRGNDGDNLDYDLENYEVDGAEMDCNESYLIADEAKMG
jgi:hypothetical protein